MQRARKIAVVAHCILNANARVEGLARYPGVHPVVESLGRHGYGIVQLPCPELRIRGLDRPPAPIEEYDTPEYRRLCREMAEEIAAEVVRYLDAGVAVPLFIGVEGSPSCGVTVTNRAAAAAPGEISRRVQGSGVLADEVRTRLRPLGVRFVAIDGRERDGGLSRIESIIGEPGA